MPAIRGLPDDFAAMGRSYRGAIYMPFGANA
jgi:hypothetical protein